MIQAELGGLPVDQIACHGADEDEEKPVHCEEEKNGSDAGSDQLRQDPLEETKHSVVNFTFLTSTVYLIEFPASQSTVEVVALEIRQADDLVCDTSREHEPQYTVVSIQ